MALIVPCVVDEDVDCAMCSDDLPDSLLDSGRIGEVTVHIERSWTAFRCKGVNELPRRIVLNIEKSDAGILVRKVGNQRSSDASGSAGDDNGAAFQAGVA